jgi:hypothetical protein
MTNVGTVGNTVTGKQFQKNFLSHESGVFGWRITFLNDPKMNIIDITPIVLAVVISNKVLSASQEVL